MGRKGLAWGRQTCVPAGMGAVAQQAGQPAARRCLTTGMWALKSGLYSRALGGHAAKCAYGHGCRTQQADRPACITALPQGPLGSPESVRSVTDRIPSIISSVQSCAVMGYVPIERASCQA